MRQDHENACVCVCNSRQVAVCRVCDINSLPQNLLAKAPTFGELNPSNIVAAAAAAAVVSKPPDDDFLGTAAASPTARSRSSTSVGTNRACGKRATHTMEQSKSTTLSHGVVSACDYNSCKLCHEATESSTTAWSRELWQHHAGGLVSQGRAAAAILSFVATSKTCHRAVLTVVKIILRIHAAVNALVTTIL